MEETKLCSHILRIVILDNLVFLSKTSIYFAMVFSIWINLYQLVHNWTLCSIHPSPKKCQKCPNLFWVFHVSELDARPAVKLGHSTVLLRAVISELVGFLNGEFYHVSSQWVEGEGDMVTADYLNIASESEKRVSNSLVQINSQVESWKNWEKLKDNDEVRQISIITPAWYALNSRSLLIKKMVHTC